MNAYRRVLLVPLIGCLCACGAPDATEQSAIGELLELGDGAVVADVGAGDGVLLGYLAATVGATGEVFGTELDPAQLEVLNALVLREGWRHVRVVAATASETGLPDACCDAIVLRHVYHHLTDPEATLAGLRRALRTGGRLLVIDFEPTELLAPWTPDELPDSRTGHGITPAVIKREAKAAGFRVVTIVEDWPGGHWPMAHFAVLLD